MIDGRKKMSSTNPTSYVKSPFLKSVLDEEGTSCEEKIEKIKGLVEGKKLSLLKSGQSATGSSQTNSNNAPNGNAPLNSNNNGNVPLAPSNESDAVLSGLSGNKERQLGETILDEINRSNLIDYDKNTFEIIVQSEVIKFSNIKNLISFCVTSNAAQIPIGCTIFIEALMQIKASIASLRSGDAQIIKEDLLRVRALHEQDSNSMRPSLPNTDGGAEADSGGGEATIESGGGSGVADSGVGSEGVSVELPREGVDAEIGDGNRRGRKRKVASSSEEELAPAKRRFNVPESDLSNLRRYGNGSMTWEC